MFRKARDASNQPDDAEEVEEKQLAPADVLPPENIAAGRAAPEEALPIMKTGGLYDPSKSEPVEYDTDEVSSFFLGVLYNAF